MALSSVFESREGVQLDAVDSPEHALFHVGVGLAQLPQQHLHLLALALPDSVAGGIPGLGKAAGTLEETQVIIVLPGDDGILMDAVEGADELHAREIFAVELGGHGLQLCAVEEPQKRRLDDVGEMMAQSDLGTPQLPGLAVQKAPAHPGAEITGILLHLDRNVKDIAFKHRDGDSQPGSVLFDQCPVGGVITWIHHQKLQVKGPVRVLLEFLHQLCQHHGILSAGDAHGNAVSRRDQLVPLHSGDKGVPQALAIRLDEASLRDLLGGKFS